MRSLKEFNEIIEYIEKHLDSEINEIEIAEISSYSYAMFGRIFSIISDFSLGEYIRLRRLSKAAIDLRETEQKIIDIAEKYGYSSVDAFSYAFKKFHNKTPFAVRKGADFRIFPPIRFSLSVKGGKMLEIKIKEKKGFKIAGLPVTRDLNSISMDSWKKLISKLNERGIQKLGSGQCYGACFEIGEQNTFCYMLGYDVSDEETSRQLGMEILNVPASIYAVVELVGQVPNCIHEGWQYVVETFFPQEGYKHAGTPDFEVYLEGNMSSPNYKMELWIPIENE